MAVDGIGGYAAYAAAGSTKKTASGTPQSDKLASGDDAETAFLKEARKTPAQRIREQWLKSHNMTEDDLQKKTPEERKVIEDSIAQDIKRRLTNKQDRRGALLDMAA